MKFSQLAKSQYFGKRQLQGQEKQQLEDGITLHQRLLFGRDPDMDLEIPEDASGKLDLWSSQIDAYLSEERISYLRERLPEIAATVNEHREASVEQVGRRLKGNKVAEVTRGVYEGIISGQHMFLYGTAGVGKTTLVELLCRWMRLPYGRIDGQTDMADIHMMGGFLPVNGSLRWTPSGLMMAGNVILLVDELPRIPASVSNVLLQPMAERSMAFSDLADGGMREVDLSPGFTVIGTGNPFHYGGMAQKNEAVFDRFGMGFDMPHPEHESRIEMLRHRDFYPEVRQVKSKNDGGVFGVPGLALDDKPLTLLDLHAAVRFVKMQHDEPFPDQNRERLIRISEMVSPADYRKRVGWTQSEGDARIRRGPLPGQGGNKGDAVLARFIEKFDELLESVVQEGSNPRGEEMMDQVARASALASGRVAVGQSDLRTAAQRSLRFRLKPYPGQEEKLAELIRIAGAFWTQDREIYGENDHSVSDATWRWLGLRKDGADIQYIFG